MEGVACLVTPGLAVFSYIAGNLAWKPGGRHSEGLSALVIRLLHSVYLYVALCDHIDGYLADQTQQILI